MTRAPVRIALAVVLLTACSDLATHPVRRPAALALDPDTVLATEGDSVEVKLAVVDERGRPFDLPSWAPPIWVSEDTRKVNLNGGALRLLAPGGSWVDVEVAGLFARVLVRTNPKLLSLRVGAAYLTQSVQRLDGTVPLVAGRDAFLRVFLLGDQPSYFRPRVRVTLYSRGAPTQTLDLAPASDSIPIAVDEGSLASSWNVTIPGSVVQPGLSFAIDADPDGRVPLAPGSGTRFPASGTISPAVRAVPPLALRLIPVRQRAFGTTGDVTEGSVEPYLASLRQLWPVRDLDVDVRTTYETGARLDSEDGWLQILEEIDALRVADGSDRNYYGVAHLQGGPGIVGIGYVGWPDAVGGDDPDLASETLAHELGHNFGLFHAPCGGASGTDPNYPYNAARTGAFGYDATAGTVKIPAEQHDIMSYCTPKWVSDYNYEKVFELRAAAAAREGTAAEDGVLVWGRTGAGGAVLEPAFRLSLHPHLPEGRGPYRVEGFDAGGARLFSLSFAAHPVDHAAGAGSFAFALPARLAQADRLARLHLVGPDGEAWQESRSPVAPRLTRLRRGTRTTLAWGPGTGMALVRDLATGEIVSFARGESVEVETGRPLEVLFSSGVGTARRMVVPATDSRP
jgi:hypothetical protein